MNDTELKITKSAMLKAAEKYPNAKEVFKTIWPEEFEDDKYFDLGRPGQPVFNRNNVIIDVALGEAGKAVEHLARRAFYLNGDHGNISWELKEVSLGDYYLIPKKRIVIFSQ